MKMIAVSRPSIGLREQIAVSRVLRSGKLAQGPEVESFEREFSQTLLDGRSVVAVNSGTSGLHLGMLAMGIGPGDEVIVPSFTFAATPNSVVLAGATPVFCDVSYSTFTLDVEQLEGLVSPSTRAIMPVHLFGYPAEMDKIRTIASRFGLWVIEDAAQAHGASFAGEKVGTLGDASMFSLYATKNMTSGEGGMIAFADDGTADHLRLLRNQGMKTRYQNEIVGFNTRMSDVHAAIGRVQLSKVELMTEKRRRNARFLSHRLRGVVLPIEEESSIHVYHQYTVRVADDRDGFAEALSAEHSVQSGVYYPVPCHRLPSLTKYSSGPLPETDKAAAEVLSLPVHPGLTKRQLNRIVEAVNSVAQAGS